MPYIFPPQKKNKSKIIFFFKNYFHQNLIAFQNMNPIVLDVIQSTRTTTDMTPPRPKTLYTTRYTFTRTDPLHQRDTSSQSISP